MHSKHLNGLKVQNSLVFNECFVFFKNKVFFCQMKWHIRQYLPVACQTTAKRTICYRDGENRRLNIVWAEEQRCRGTLWPHNKEIVVMIICPWRLHVVPLSACVRSIKLLQLPPTSLVYTDHSQLSAIIVVCVCVLLPVAIRWWSQNRQGQTAAPWVLEK